MEAGILHMQYEVLNAFIWDNSFQMLVYTGNLFATSKWSEHFFLILSTAIYHLHAGMNLLIVYEKQITKNLTNKLVK